MSTPQAIAAALLPRPRPNGMRLVHCSSKPGIHRPTRSNTLARGPQDQIRGVVGLGSAPAVAETSFHRSSARPRQSKPGPRLALVAGARTTIGRQVELVRA